MALTVLLTIIAFIIMYVRKGGEQSTNTHSVLGLIVGILCFMQPIMAFVRPAPETKNRFWFNWAHWLVGNAAHVLASECMVM
jgi:cytochrome b561